MTYERISRQGAAAHLYWDGPEWGRMRSLTIGGLSCPTADAGYALLRDICEIAERKGYAAIIGPMDGDTWHAYRLVTESDGSNSFLMEPPQSEAALKALDLAGFRIIERYFSSRLAIDDLPESDEEERTGFRIETWDGSDPDRFFAEVHGLSCRAFADNPFYRPISQDQFLDLYRPYVPLMQPDLIFFARDTSGSMEGFLFGIPNYQEGPTPQSVILKTYAGIRPGVGKSLSQRFHTAVKAMKFETVIHALIHDDNVSGKRSEAMGGKIFRRYGLFGRELDG
ncbi:MAG: hypothetical protein AAGH74_03640 [Pseudomonadota bacterium]